MTLHTGFVVTDYTCSPGAAAGALDYYFIPHESLAEEFAANGVPREKLVTSGIPIDVRFGRCAEREEARKTLGLGPPQQHLVMMCGSMGCGPMEELTDFFVRKLPEDVMLTVVCGSNEKLRRHLSKIAQGHHSIRVYGFVTDMPELLSGADLCLTKPGGLSATETAAAGVPMVLIDAVAGCEAHNMRFFLNCGGAVTAGDPQQLGELCLSLLRDSTQRREMSARLRSVSKPDAAEAVRAVMESVSAVV